LQFLPWFHCDPWYLGHVRLKPMQLQLWLQSPNNRMVVAEIVVVDCFLKPWTKLKCSLLCDFGLDLLLKLEFFLCIVAKTVKGFQLKFTPNLILIREQCKKTVEGFNLGFLRIWMGLFLVRISNVNREESCYYHLRNFNLSSSKC